MSFHSEKNKKFTYTMKIDHLAIWVEDLETMRQFYLRYFDTSCGEKYFNPKRNYTSYFLTFAGGECRIELMVQPAILDNRPDRGLIKGLAHFSINVGSKESVNELTERLRADGYRIIGEPRTTGDGYYESVILDPEGNYVELTT